MSLFCGNTCKCKKRCDQLSYGLDIPCKKACKGDPSILPEEVISMIPNDFLVGSPYERFSPFVAPVYPREIIPRKSKCKNRCEVYFSYQEALEKGCKAKCQSDKRLDPRAYWESLPFEVKQQYNSGISISCKPEFLVDEYQFGRFQEPPAHCDIDTICNDPEARAKLPYCSTYEETYQQKIFSAKKQQGNILIFVLLAGILLIGFIMYKN